MCLHSMLCNEKRILPICKCKFENVKLHTKYISAQIAEPEESVALVVSILQDL